MELWAARETDNRTNIYTSEPVFNSDSFWEESGDSDSLISYNNKFSHLACRGVKPGQKRKLTKFDPINEIVEYEDSLEERHQRLVDAVKKWHLGRGIVEQTNLTEFLRTEGYIS